MLGHIVLIQGKGWRPTVEVETVRGLPVLCARIPVKAGIREHAIRCRILRAVRLLRRAGIRRVLSDEGFMWWTFLREWELLPMDVEAFCQRLASRLALAALARKGVSPAQAIVALRGNRVSRPFFQAAMELAPVVRAMAVTSPNGGEALSAYLRQEYGVPVLEEGVGATADLTLEFSFLQGGTDERLILYGDVELNGVEVIPEEGNWPSEFAPLPLAAALWESGIMNLGKFICL